MVDIVPGEVGPKWRATAALLPDGHVEFTHECNGEGATATLPMPPWRVLVGTPLTVEPSVRCRSCGWHGWIANGLAVPS